MPNKTYEEVRSASGVYADYFVTEAFACKVNGADTLTVNPSGNLSTTGSIAGASVAATGAVTGATGNFTGQVTVNSGTAIPAAGAAGAGILLSSTAAFGIYFGSGAPTLSAAKGSLYLRSDGSSSTTRAYINTDGATTWTAISTVA